jgi:hypothetical protein
MQVYELGADEKTNKASATVEYDIASTDKNDSVIHILESADQMEKIGKQITLKKDPTRCESPARRPQTPNPGT